MTLPFLAGYFVSYLYRAINAVLAPALAVEFGLSAGGLGLLSSMYFFAFALFQLPLGLLLDRFGPRRVNATLLLIAAVGGAWFAVAQTAPSAIAARALIGIGVSGCLMASFQAFVLWYPPERIATMNGVAFTAGALGAMTVTVPLELLLRIWHWREAYLLIAGATVAVSLVLWLWVPERSAPRKVDGWRAQLGDLAQLLRDPAFQRIAFCLGASQCAAVSLVTLWVGTWLRDVAGAGPAEVARGLLAVNASMIMGYIGFGRAADAASRHGQSALRLFLGGLAVSSLALALIALGLHGGSVLPWCLFAGCSTAVLIGYPMLTRRYPPGMAGRVNTGVNLCGFIGMFTGQWAVGIVLDQWPRTASGYAPEAYGWAFGLLWLVQSAGLVWLWRGRQLFQR